MDPFSHPFLPQSGLSTLRPLRITEVLHEVRTYGEEKVFPRVDDLRYGRVILGKRGSLTLESKGTRIPIREGRGCQEGEKTGPLFKRHPIPFMRRNPNNERKTETHTSRISIPLNNKPPSFNQSEKEEYRNHNTKLSREEGFQCLYQYLYNKLLKSQKN